MWVVGGRRAAPEGQQRVVEGPARHLHLVAGARDHGAVGAESLRQLVADGVKRGVMGARDDKRGKRRRADRVEGQLGLPARAPVPQRADPTGEMLEQRGGNLPGRHTDDPQKRLDKRPVSEIAPRAEVAQRATKLATTGASRHTANAGGSTSVSDRTRCGSCAAANTAPSPP